MRGLMTTLENTFVAATFAEVGEFEAAICSSVKVFGRFLCQSNRKDRISEHDINLHEEIVTVARDLYERNGRTKGRDLDNWLEAERIVRTLRKIAGDDGKRYFFVNVPEAKYGGKKRNRMESLSFLRAEPTERLQKSLRRYA